mmetsp:Transcript_102575/g.289784  ORF Transcript_102575/g.289784 Transcript_102575/m.289784 type:complete len:224 (-) Transcript_102575:885-1556(-)
MELCSHSRRPRTRPHPFGMGAQKAGAASRGISHPWSPYLSSGSVLRPRERRKNRAAGGRGPRAGRGLCGDVGAPPHFGPLCMRDLPGAATFLPWGQRSGWLARSALEPSAVWYQRRWRRSFQRRSRNRRTRGQSRPMSSPVAAACATTVSASNRSHNPIALHWVICSAGPCCVATSSGAMPQLHSVHITVLSRSNMAGSATYDSRTVCELCTSSAPCPESRNP